MRWFVMLTAVSCIVYIFVIRPKVREFRSIADIRDRLESAELRPFVKFKLRLLGLKTWSVAAAGVFVTALPGMLETLRLVDFSAFFTPEIALKISGAIMILMSVTHVLGLVAAAKIEPKADDK